MQLITFVACMTIMLALLYAISRSIREEERKRMDEMIKREKETFHGVEDAFPSWFRESEENMKRRLRR